MPTNLSTLGTIPFSGGQNTYNDPTLLPSGSLSSSQNIRHAHPGFKSRMGMIKQHSTADGTNKVLSMFQFSKGKRTERHFYAQMSDDDVLEATTAPPGVTYETMTLDVSPATDWAAGDIITGQASNKTCICAVKLSATTYSVYGRTGAFTLGEIVGVTGTAAKLADQGAANPTFAGGEFGTEVFSGSSSSLPATWSVLNDKLIFSNGVDQHQICAGTEDIISKFIVYDSDTKLPAIPSVGTDYTSEVNYGGSGTVAVLDSLGNFAAGTGTVTCGIGGVSVVGTGTAFLTELEVGQTIYVDAAEKNTVATITSNIAATVTTNWSADRTTKTFTKTNDCILICSPIMPNRVTFTVTAVNGNDSVAAVAYSSTTGWKMASSVVDGTIASAGKTLSGSGAITFTQPTDAAPKYMYGRNGFWVKISFSAALDAEVEVSTVTYGSGFTAIQNVWDGSLEDAIEAQFYKNSTAVYYLYGSTSISVGAMTTSDYVYFNTADPALAVLIDPAGTPNTTASTTISTFEYLNAAGAWTTVGTYTDGTSGLSKIGYVTFSRQTDVAPVQFNGSVYQSYWYRFKVNKTLSATVNIGIQYIPYFDISDFGVGLCNATWKDNSVFVFDQDPSWIYVSAPGNSQVLSSINSAIYQAGDGRANKILAMKGFYNELLIAQEEKGNAGGCITLIQGTKPENYGKILISNKYGVISSQGMEVVETIEGGHNAYFLSKRGILFSDGRGIAFIKGFEQIRNYFDPTFPNDCIRAGYESKMYLKYDSVFHILKIGLVVGTTATEVNKVLVYNLIDKNFSTDVYQYALASECEVESASGNVPFTLLGGGQADGFVYIQNSGIDDISTAVDSYVTLEFNVKGKIIRDREMIFRCKVQTAGDLTVTPYYNGVVQTDMAQTLSMTAENSGDRTRRHRMNLNFKDQNVSVKIQHNTATESMYLLDYGVALEDYVEQ